MHATAFITWDLRIQIQSLCLWEKILSCSSDWLPTHKMPHKIRHHTWMWMLATKLRSSERTATASAFNCRTISLPPKFHRVALCQVTAPPFSVLTSHMFPLHSWWHPVFTAVLSHTRPLPASASLHLLFPLCGTLLPESTWADLY